MPMRAIRQTFLKEVSVCRPSIRTRLSRDLTLVQAVTMPASQAPLLQSFFSQKPNIILGSESYSRRLLMDELAAQYGFAYSTTKADIDEQALGCRNSDPQQLVLLLARAKARAIMDRHTSPHNGYLLTCDQVVVHEGRILEKPRNAEEARNFIAGYSRSPGKTVGAVICTNLSTGTTHEGVDTAEIHFKDIPDSVIDQLLEEGMVYRCAGGLMIEHPSVSPLITKIEGTQDSIMGLPKQLVLKLLLQAAGLA